MKRIQEDFKIKDNKTESTDIYIGMKLASMKLESGKYCWTRSP